jgi:hypothetical protein
MTSQHIDQQNELIKSLQERIQHNEGANAEGDGDTVSKQREVRNSGRRPSPWSMSTGLTVTVGGTPGNHPAPSTRNFPHLLCMV